MDRRPTVLRGCAKHAEPEHTEHMEYDGMSKGMVHQGGKHWWYIIMQSTSKAKEGGEIGNVEGIGISKVDD
jgi:hypothetical protein